MEPNCAFTHTVLGLWLEREKAGRRDTEETEKTKVGKERRWRGFSLRGTSRAFVKAHVTGPRHEPLPPSPLLRWHPSPLLFSFPHPQLTRAGGGVMT